jgi:hypothetical protein
MELAPGRLAQTTILDNQIDQSQDFGRGNVAPLPERLQGQL